MNWIGKFRNQKINYIELVDRYIADDCAVLDFKMDCGHALERVYGVAVYDYEELDNVIDEVTGYVTARFYKLLKVEIF